MGPQMGPQMAQGDNSAAIAIGLILFLALIGFLVWWFIFKKTEGDKCKPKTADKVTGADKYVYDSEGNCIVSECLADYSLSDGTCAENEDCAVQWPTTFTLTTGGNGACFRTATTITEQSGTGKNCPSVMTEYFSATDSNCLPLQPLVNAVANSSLVTPDPTPTGTNLNILIKRPAAGGATRQNLLYGQYIYSANIFSNGSNVYNNTITPAGTSNIMTFVPVSGSGRKYIGTGNDVLAISVPGLDVLKWVSSTELRPVFKYVKNGDYSAATYDTLKFNISLTSDVLTLASKSVPANTFIIDVAEIPFDQMSFYDARLSDPTGYNVGQINEKCSNFATIDNIVITDAMISTSSTATNLPGLNITEMAKLKDTTGTGGSPGNALRACGDLCDKTSTCKSFRFNQQSDGGFCRLYSVATVPLAQYTRPDELGELCYNKK
jgi:hypothetical protein